MKPKEIIWALLVVWISISCENDTCDEPITLNDNLYFSILDTLGNDIFLSGYNVDSLHIRSENSRTINFSHVYRHPKTNVIISNLIENYSKAISGDSIKEKLIIQFSKTDMDTIELNYSGKRIISDCQRDDFIFFNLNYHKIKYVWNFNSNIIFIKYK